MNIRRKLRQKCVYWAPNGNSDEGQPTYDAPVELRARIVRDTLQVDKDGRSLISQTQVSTEVNLAEGGMVFLGSWQDLVDLYPTASLTLEPLQVPGCWEVKHTTETPDLKARNFWRTAYL